MEKTLDTAVRNLVMATTPNTTRIGVAVAPMALTMLVNETLTVNTTDTPLQEETSVKEILETLEISETPVNTVRFGTIKIPLPEI